MKKDAPLIAGTSGFVILVHIALITLAWQTRSLPEPVAAGNLTMIDLGSIHGNQAQLSDGAPAPLETAPPVKQPETPKMETIKPPTPKTTPTRKNTIATVSRQDKTADLTETPKKITPSTEPIRQPEKTTPNKTAATPPNQPSTTANHQAAIRHENGVSTGGQGKNPNSTQPSNPAGDTGAGTGSKEQGDKPSTQANIDPNKIVDGGAISLPAPPYPARARENEEEGTVRITVIVEPNGVISDATISASSGSRILDNAALAAARKAKIRPKQINGIAVRSRFVVPYQFNLDK